MEYVDQCSVCDAVGCFRRTVASIRESFACGQCGATLRYQTQASVILTLFSKLGARSLKQLVQEDEFRQLAVYEPGLVGPFRSLLRTIPCYETSYYWENVARGEMNRGVRCEDLTALTFGDESFDLVITSDILEHVRKPFLALREIQRVLRRGGVHVFSIPVQHPMPRKTRYRVDVSGDQDRFILPKHYHGSPVGERSLVYVDFGADLVEVSASHGVSVEVVRLESGNEYARRLLTFVSRKPTVGPERRAPAAARRPVSAGVSVCIICGGRSFSEGPLGRRSSTGRLPRCDGCGSLERHRLLRRIWDHLPVDLLRGKIALQFGRDRVVEPGWFGELEASPLGDSRSLDPQRIERLSGTFDVVLCNYVLQNVRNDRLALRELHRILKPGGFLQFSVPSPFQRESTDEWGFADPQRQGRYRIYGRDLLQRFEGCMVGSRILEVQSIDEITDVSDYAYFSSLDHATIERLRCSAGSGFETRIVETRGVTG